MDGPFHQTVEQTNLCEGTRRSARPLCYPVPVCNNWNGAWGTDGSAKGCFLWSLDVFCHNLTSSHAHPGALHKSLIFSLMKTLVSRSREKSLVVVDFVPKSFLTAQNYGNNAVASNNDHKFQLLWSFFFFPFFFQNLSAKTHWKLRHSDVSRCYL